MLTLIATSVDFVEPKMEGLGRLQVTSRAIRGRNRGMTLLSLSCLLLLTVQQFGRTNAFISPQTGSRRRATVLGATNGESEERLEIQSRRRSRDPFSLGYSRTSGMDQEELSALVDMKQSQEAVKSATFSIEPIAGLEDPQGADLFELYRQGGEAVVEEPGFPLPTEDNTIQMFEPFDDFVQDLVVKSRPKQKQVSPHSIFGGVTFGVLVTTFAARFHPGFYESGIPSIFPIKGDLPSELALQFMLSISMLCGTAIMGLFRVPRRAPLLRKRMFDLAAASCVYVTEIGISSANGVVDDWWYDTFTIPGKIAFAAGFIYYVTANVRFIDEVAGGSGRGKETVSGWDTEIGTIMNTFVLWAVTITEVAFFPVVMGSDLDSYTQHVSQVFRDNQYESFFLVACISGSTIAAIGSLLTTMQLEKKITPAMGAFGAVFLQFTLNLDAVGSAVDVIFGSDGLTEINEYMFPFVLDSHVVEVYTAICFVALLNGLRKKSAGITNDPASRKKAGRTNEDTGELLLSGVTSVDSDTLLL